jgi:hypothetical protein
MHGEPFARALALLAIEKIINIFLHYGHGIRIYEDT